MDSTTCIESRVIAFRPRAAPVRPGLPPGLTMSERIVALRWAEAAAARGVRRVQFHQPEPGDDPATSAFLLVYRRDDLWASWGVARLRGGYEVWRPSTGRTVGRFADLADALDAIEDVRAGARTLELAAD